MSFVCRTEFWESRCRKQTPLRSVQMNSIVLEVMWKLKLIINHNDVPAGVNKDNIRAGCKRCGYREYLWRLCPVTVFKRLRWALSESFWGFFFFLPPQPVTSRSSVVTLCVWTRGRTSFWTWAVRAARRARRKDSRKSTRRRSSGAAALKVENRMVSGCGLTKK